VVSVWYMCSFWCSHDSCTEWNYMVWWFPLLLLFRNGVQKPDSNATCHAGWCSDSALHLYLRGTCFHFQPYYWLSLLRFAFYSLFRKTLGYCFLTMVTSRSLTIHGHLLISFDAIITFATETPSWNNLMWGM